MMAGAYTPFRTKISPEEKKMFKEVMSNLKGVDYEPLAVATQVVSGTNYKFFCNATVVYPGAPTKPVMVIIYKPLDGAPTLTGIEEIS